MLQPARCRRLIRTQPISYLPQATTYACHGDSMMALRRAHGDSHRGTQNQGRIFSCVARGPHSPQPSEITCTSKAMLDRVPPRTCADPMRPTCWVTDRAWSVLAEKLLCRLHGLRAEIVVPDAGKAHETFGRVDQAVEALGQRHRHDIVAVAVQHQHRCRDLSDAQIRAELILPQQPNRHAPISV